MAMVCGGRAERRWSSATPKSVGQLGLRDALFILLEAHDDQAHDVEQVKVPEHRLRKQRDLQKEPR